MYSHLVLATRPADSNTLSQMAGAAGVNQSLKAFMNGWKAKKSAKLTLKSVEGELSVILEVSLGRYENGRTLETSRGYQGLQARQVGPSQSRRRARRLADPEVQQRAAEHAAVAATEHAAAEEAAAEHAAAEEAAAEKAAEAPAEQPTAEKAASSSAEQASADPGDEAMTAAQAAVADDIPAPRICRKCSQPCRGHVGPTGKRCRNVSSPPLPPPEKVWASSSPQAYLLPSPGREETRKREDSGSPSNYSPQPSPLQASPQIWASTPKEFIPVWLHVLHVLRTPPHSYSVRRTSPSCGRIIEELKCGNLCEDTDIQPLGCHHSEFHSDLHPGMVEVWPRCCGNYWNSLWNMNMGSIRNM